ncbi:MarR family winged helix-turn-helix transcriptional regulator [Streptomyces sp. NPDC059637]|uniref:MarR family winged helix-turn-helix transcriptional regulator n=1 Tax=Streptomyces sp. NPDC059637 TaxID=3347752 RepID=UPI0036BB63EA
MQSRPDTAVPDTAVPNTAEAAVDDLMWRQVAALHSRVEHRLTTALQRHHGLGLSEYRALGHLSAADDSELRMQELADRIALNQSSVTRLVARMNEAGWTYRDVCMNDKRGVYTVLTDAGRALHSRARSTYEQTLAAALDEAAHSSPELGTAVAALRRAFS